ncbi:MAG: hypothetical protein IPP79_11115 [Chitinophagaceae bacterium]|nr:hypothetical protein [Chitinophagaceae bacterium]
MKYSNWKISLLLAMFCFGISLSSQAQLLKKLKEKASQAAEKVLDKKVDEAVGVNNGNNSNNGTGGNGSNSGNGKMSNKGGGGLKNSTPPDVMAQIADAEKAHTANNLNDARYSIQQALMGVEIQLGREILASLPAKANGMDKDTAKNIVMSNQWGWNNMTIQTVYNQAPDKQMTISIGNNTMYAGMVTVFFANSGYTQANDKDQNMKQTRLKGYKAIIQYEDSKGYTLIVQLGQSSLIVWECVNFASEDDVMKTAELFDIDGIKKMMGEQ